MAWVIGMFALLFAATAIVSPAVIQQREIFAASQNMTTGQVTSSEKIQHLSKANVWVVVSVFIFYVSGVVFFTLYFLSVLVQQSTFSYFDMIQFKSRNRI